MNPTKHRPLDPARQRERPSGSRYVWPVVILWDGILIGAIGGSRMSHSAGAGPLGLHAGHLLGMAIGLLLGLLAIYGLRRGEERG